jgi:glycosyltransferase involved in cell wall biosynthesis
VFRAGAAIGDAKGVGLSVNTNQAVAFPAKWPPVTVLIVTFNRPEIIRRVIQRYELYLQYAGLLIWRLADDGSVPGYVESLQKEFARLNLQATVTKRGGFGMNLNNGLREAFKVSPYVFLTEDDWVTKDYISVTKGVWLLASVPQVGLVRYDEIGIGTHLDGAVLKHPTLSLRDAWVRYFVFGKKSQYIYPGGHPNLVHKRYYDAYGFYKEGGEIASVERAFSHVLATKPGPEVVVMSDYVGISKFGHAGKTWKGTAEGDPNFGKR